MFPNYMLSSQSSDAFSIKIYGWKFLLHMAVSGKFVKERTLDYLPKQAVGFENMSPRPAINIAVSPTLRPLQTRNKI